MTPDDNDEPYYTFPRPRYENDEPEYSLQFAHERPRPLRWHHFDAPLSEEILKFDVYKIVGLIDDEVVKANTPGVAPFFVAVCIEEMRFKDMYFASFITDGEKYAYPFYGEGTEGNIRFLWHAADQSQIRAAITKFVESKT